MPLHRVSGPVFDALVGHADGRRGRSCLEAEASVRRSTAGILLTLALGLLPTPLAAEAQRPAGVARVGLLSAGSPTPHLLDAFREGMRERGYLEGTNLTIEPRWAEGRFDRLPDLVAELVRARVDVIVTSGAPAAFAAKQGTSAIPIVMAQISDPVGLGLVASLPQPGGNITGLANLHSDLGPKQLELLKEAVPKAARVAVLWNPGNPGAELIVKHSQHGARALRMTLHPVEVRDAKALESAFAAMARERANALLLPPDPFFLPHGRQIVDLAAKRRLPAMYGWRELVEAGGLMAYGPHIPDMFRRAATYVDKILKGAKPADLPVEQPMRFEMVINMKTAKVLGITFPQTILIRADQVIQ